MDLGHGQIGARHDADEHRLGFVQDRPAFQQGTGQQFPDDFPRAMLAAGVRAGERAFRALSAHDRAEVGKIHVDDSRARQQPPDAAQPLGEQVVRDFERLKEAGVVVD